MRGLSYADVCAGISAATVAWKPLGFRTAFYSEIDKFPSAVLRHHYPDTPNLGDMTRFEDWPDASLDVFVGGTPCQGFSVAGLRNGMDDPRSNLALCFGRIAQRYKPRWIVWENVPGVRSSDGGRDLGAFFRGLAELGYGLAWRSLDAQYAGLAQRRERLFAVGYLGDWRPAAAVLFEPESLRWDSAPRREARQGVAHSVTTRVGNSSRPAGATGNIVAYGGNNTAGPIDIATAVNAHGGPHGRQDFESETFIAHSLRADGFDASEDGTGRGTPIVPVAFGWNKSPSQTMQVGDTTDALQASPTSNPAVACFKGGQGSKARDIGYSEHLAPTLSSAESGTQRSPTLMQGWAVRRLTPTECERLQGFPDGYTDIPWRGKSTAPDGPRYKALGNSIAVPCLMWIGQRIFLCEEAMQSIDRRAA